MGVWLIRGLGYSMDWTILAVKTTIKALNTKTIQVLPFTEKFFARAVSVLKAIILNQARSERGCYRCGNTLFDRVTLIVYDCEEIRLTCTFMFASINFEWNPPAFGIPSHAPVLNGNTITVFEIYYVSSIQNVLLSRKTEFNLIFFTVKLFWL